MFSQAFPTQLAVQQVVIGFTPIAYLFGTLPSVLDGCAFFSFQSSAESNKQAVQNHVDSFNAFLDHFLDSTLAASVGIKPCN